MRARLGYHAKIQSSLSSSAVDPLHRGRESDRVLRVAVRLVNMVLRSVRCFPMKYLGELPVDIHQFKLGARYVSGFSTQSFPLLCVHLGALKVASSMNARCLFILCAPIWNGIAFL